MIANIHGRKTEVIDTLIHPIYLNELLSGELSNPSVGALDELLTAHQGFLPSESSGTLPLLPLQ